ncbi:MAG: methionine--tRNA ligase [Nitrospirae bacterium]|nr:MAG: methionine--tRNA ligase [Nitrospirota bacterium]
MPAPVYITTPIYYVNDIPHIGHAYTTIAADVLARFHRLRGHPVFFLTGLDEHGQKVQQAAAKAGIDPQTHCDQLAPRFIELWKTLTISHDAFIRTTDPTHQAIVQQCLQALYDRGLIYQAEYTGWYCTFDERFWTEKDVVRGLCPDCQRPVERLSERNYFFRMSRFHQPLLDYIHAHPTFIRPTTRSNEVVGFLQRPLEDLSISRPKTRVSWGIELPFDSDYVTYVWFDALVNYLSALDYLAPPEGRATFWPATVHLVGKDILTTHAVYWSTILMALNLPLPRTIFAHGWWTVEGEKMSKSRGNVVDPFAMVKEFGADAFRYFLLREVPFGHDGDFSRESLISRINSDLANGLGNLVSRTVTMIQRFAKGRIPAPVTAETGQLEAELQQAATTLLQEKLPTHLETTRLEFHRALEAIWGVVQLGNQYIDRTAPWVLAKDPGRQARLNTVLYHTVETLRFLSLAIAPFMPTTAHAINAQLRLGLTFSHADDTVRWGELPPGQPVEKGAALFPRISTEAQIPTTSSKEALSSHTGQPHSTASAPPHDSLITIEDFQRIHLKVGTILQAERVPKSHKLLKLQVDLGTEQRQIIAGIGKQYAPETLIGRTVVIVANLKPAKLMGLESQGMVLAAGDEEVKGLVTIQEPVEPGTQVK